jgi:hypothetical protein
MKSWDQNVLNMKLKWMFQTWRVISSWQETTGYKRCPAEGRKNMGEYYEGAAALGRERLTEKLYWQMSHKKVEKSNKKGEEGWGGRQGGRGMKSGRRKSERRGRRRKKIWVETFTVNICSGVFQNDQPYENGVDIQCFGDSHCLDHWTDGWFLEKTPVKEKRFINTIIYKTIDCNMQTK